MFIADLRQRRIHDNNPKYKPGRQIVTFLLITNLGLWITYNFEIQKVVIAIRFFLRIETYIVIKGNDNENKYYICFLYLG